MIKTVRFVPGCLVRTPLEPLRAILRAAFSGRCGNPRKLKDLATMQLADAIFEPHETVSRNKAIRGEVN